jgi:hypothetical protein
MVQAIVVDARYTRIWLGTAPAAVGPPPAVKVCAMDRKAINQALGTNTAVIPDCDNPVAVVPVKRTAISKDTTISGTGFYEPDLRAPLQAFFDAAVAGDVCFEIMEPTGDAGYYGGKFFLTTFNIVGNNDDGYVTCELTWEADGPAPWTALP